MRSRFCLFFCLIIGVTASLPVVLFAQLSRGGLPDSFSRAIAPDYSHVITFQPPSADRLSVEDQKSPLPYRFAVNLPVDKGIASSGEWTTADDGRKIWRLNLKSPGALALILYFDRYDIPEGGRVFIYNPKRTQLLGAFTSLNNNNLSTFATGLIYGDELTIEYDAPGNLPLPDLHISEIGHAYRGITDFAATNRGFGGSGLCEVNVNCTEGANWQKEKRSVMRIIIKRGSDNVWCTGSLVNNVRNNGKPYILTADHCGRYSSESDLSMWLFYFNYEGTGCPDPAHEPPLQSMTGATMVAHGGDGGNTGSDFFLVLLKSSIPDSFNVYYNGWNRETEPPSPSGTGIHHPQGDIKKISTYTSPLQPAHWVGNPVEAHWRVTWAATASGHGTTEGGSSGSPLFDNQGRLVGTLTGGDSSCDSLSLNLPDYYGMFSYDWDQNGTDSVSMLKCWLDPDNTGTMALNGWALSVAESAGKEWVSFFPNPVSDRLNIKTSLPQGNKLTMTIYDIWGNPWLKSDWLTGPDQEKHFDLSGFPPGMYLLEVMDADHRMVRKIVKQ